MEWDEKLLLQIQALGCVLGVTVNPGVVDFTKANPLLLDRVDTTDFLGPEKEKEHDHRKDCSGNIKWYRKRNELTNKIGDLSNGDNDRSELDIKYGLPENVAFCKRCVISNQRPNSEVEFRHTRNTSKKTIHFDKEGICDACITTQKKQKENILKKKQHRKQKHN